MSALVQVEDWEVPADVLAAAGSMLVDHPDVATAVRTNPALKSELAQLPLSGWVELHRSFGSGAGAGYVVLAAPHPDAVGAYQVVRLGQRPGGEWALAASVDPAWTAPSRERRRAGLALVVLGAPVTLVAGTDRPLATELSNTTTEPWVPFRSDAVRLLAYLSLPDSEQPLPAHTRFAHGLNNLVDRLDPGERVELAAGWATLDLSSLPPGRYVVRATLQTLMLTSPPAELTIRRP